MDERAFGDLLREFRLSAGLPQEALAERARLSAGAISALERGARRGPQHQTLSLLAEALQLDVAARGRLERAAEAARRRGARGESAAEDSRERTATNTPVMLTSFHGRGDELDALERLLSNRRLVTLLGAGGVGKTRLAIEATHRLANSGGLPDGIWFVDLTPLATSDLIATAIARLLDIRATAETPLLETLARALVPKRLLLVLDNCEHVADVIAPIVENLLRAAPGLSILVTTREALRVDGECVVRIDPLGVEVSQRRGPALDLLLERLSDANFSVFGRMPAEQIGLAAMICERLDGLPLALELAAGRARDLSLAQIAAGLEERFELLAGGRRSASPRQSTLQGAIAWSYEPLAEHERAFFARLGLFAGSFTSESAVAVCGQDLARPRDALVALIAKSLVTVVEDRAGHLRYRLLESVRAFALDRLRERPGERATERFASHFFERARFADDRYGRIPKDDFLSLVEPDLENFRAALAWSLGAERDVVLGAKLAGAMGWIYRQATLYAEGIRWAELALTHAAMLDSTTIGRLHIARSYLYFNLGGMRIALESAVAAATSYRTAGARADLAGALTAQAYCAYRFGKMEAVHAAGEEAVQLAREAGDDYRLAGALNAYALGLPADRTADRFAALEEAIRAARASGDADAIVPMAHLAAAYHEAGEFDKAVACGRAVVASARTNRDRSTLASALVNLAAYALALDRTSDAAEAAREGLELVADLGKTLNAMCALQHLGTIAARDADFVRAARLSGASDALYRDFQFDRELTEQRLYDRTIAEIRAAIGDAALERHLRAGEALPIAAAIAEALARARIVTVPQ